MRVGQFIDTDTHGGAETIVLDLCHALRERSHVPIVLHFGSEYLRARCRELGFEEQTVPRLDLYKSIVTLPRFAVSFRGFLRRQRIDVLHSHLFGPITAAAPAARLAGVGHVGTLHDVYVVAERPIRVRLLQAAALCGTRLVAVSDDMLNFYRARARFDANALRCIYNGVAIPRTHDAKKFRAELGIDAGDCVVICVGRLVELKRQRDVLSALAATGGRAPITLLVAGGGPLQQELERRAAELGIRDRVHFLGGRNDVPQLLAASDLFVLTSSTEGLSRSVLEAMASGLPAIVTRVGGNPELVVDGDTGFLVDVGDIPALTERLLELTAQPELRHRLGAAARRRAEERFSIDAMTISYLELYDAVRPR